MENLEDRTAATAENKGFKVAMSLSEEEDEKITSQADPFLSKVKSVELPPEENLSSSIKVGSAALKSAMQKTLMPASPLQELSKEPVSLFSLDVELSFLLGRQLIPLEQVKSLVEGKIITLGGSPFQISILLQEKVIAQAQLVLVDGIPSLQIIKTAST